MNNSIHYQRKSLPESHYILIATPISQEEFDFIAEYKVLSTSLENESAKLYELKKQISSLTSNGGTKEREKLHELKEIKYHTNIEIDRISQKLKKFEASQIYATILTREKKKLENERIARGNELFLEALKETHKDVYKKEIQEDTQHTKQKLKEKNKEKTKKNKVKNLLEKIEFLEIIVQGLKLFPRFLLSFIKKTFAMLVVYAISSGVSFLPVGVICWILSSLDIPYIVCLKILFPFSQIITLSLALQHIHETSSSDENSPELCFLFSLVSIILVFAI